MKRPDLQNKQVVVLRIAFRARKVLGTFEKRAPGPGISAAEAMDALIRGCAMPHTLSDVDVPIASLSWFVK